MASLTRDKYSRNLVKKKFTNSILQLLSLILFMSGATISEHILGGSSIQGVLQVISQDICFACCHAPHVLRCCGHPYGLIWTPQKLIACLSSFVYKDAHHCIFQLKQSNTKIVQKLMVVEQYKSLMHVNEDPFLWVLYRYTIT